MDRIHIRLTITLCILYLMNITMVKNDDLFSGMIYPLTKTLLNGNNILITSDGIHFFDSTFSEEDNTKKIVIEGQTLDKENYNKLSISQFSSDNDGYILILAYNRIYFLNSDGTLIISYDLSEYIDGVSYCLLPYKKDNTYLYYIITYLVGNDRFVINYFKFRYLPDYSNEQIINKTFSLKVETSGFTSTYALGGKCIFLLPPSTSSYTNDLLVCFFGLSYPAEIQARVFNPEDSFKEIEEFLRYKSDIDYPNYINALTNEKKETAFIIIIPGCIYSLTFEISISFGSPTKISREEYCGLDTNIERNKLIYFDQTKEFTFISSNFGGSQIPIMIFNDDYILKEITTINLQEVAVYGSNSASLNYGNKYILIYDDVNKDIIKLADPTFEEVSQNLNTELEVTEEETQKETTTPSFNKNIKCKTATYESASYNLCTECDSDNGYYSAQFSDNSFLHGFLECYNIDIKPSNLFFDNSNKIFKQCYQTCKTCNQAGDENTNNCLECDSNYIKQPDILDTTNCVMKCKYMYYYTSYRLYKCTSENKCPDEAKFYIEELKKCTDDCSKEEIYKYKYSGKCLKNCPENTEPNEDNICIDTNINSCTKTESEFSEKETLDYDEIDIQFYYTKIHIVLMIYH